MIKTGKQYVLRDVIHNDIAFDTRFFKVINTSEFQRLNRIKQLSFEYMVFPTATHTRFSHSIGTYSVMKRILDSLKNKLQNLGITVTDEEYDLALMSALLHDIGHAGLSHTFERLFNMGTHESWTAKIISDPSTEINRVLVEEFSKKFPEKLIKILQDEGKKFDNGIFGIIAQLVSSQVDADRMDYLLRDSYFTSVTNGNYDLDRLIRSFEIVRFKDKLTVCINEKYLSSLEEYIMGRFYMYREVYQHSIKRQMEDILIKAVKRAKEIYVAEKNIYADDIMKKLLSGEKIRVSEYTKLDDHFLMYHISRWADSEDTILSFLCTSFLNRNKFYKNKLKKSIEDPLFLKTAVKKFMHEENLNLQNEYFFIEDDISLNVFDSKRENIWILSKDGNIRDLSKASFILRNLNEQHKYKQKLEFISFDLFKAIYGKDIKPYIEKMSGEKIN